MKCKFTSSRSVLLINTTKGRKGNKNNGENKMKTTIQMKNVEIYVDGELKETVEIKNPCQMWRQLQGWRIKYGNGVRVVANRADGTKYKDFTVKVLKSGKTYMMNSIKETNRTVEARARKAAAEAKAKAEARKAKRREYDKARRARLKAEKAAKENTAE